MVPANEASEADLEAVFATPGDPRRCWCQWFKTDTNGWSRNSVAQRRALLLEQAGPGRPGAWAITCYVVVPELRGRGVMEALTRAAVEHARRSGARAVEAYPRVAEPGKRCSESELYVGLDTVLLRCGFETVSTPSETRAVLRQDFDAEA